MGQFSILQKKKQRIRVVRIITVIFFFTVLFGCSSTSIIITGNVRPPISPSEVKIYIDAPTQYETIGIVDASRDVGYSRQSTQDKVINELKSRAAKVGANGILLTTTGTQSSNGMLLTTTGTQSNGSTEFYSNGILNGGTSEKIIAQGKAIYVIQE